MNNERKDTELMVQECEMEFICPRNWSDLEPTADENRRHCGVCKKDVHAAYDSVTIERLTAEGKCMAVNPLFDKDLEDMISTFEILGSRRKAT